MNTEKENKRANILFRSQIVFAVLTFLSILALGRIMLLQTVYRQEWQSKLDDTASERTSKPVESMRGSIYAADGSLLATTVPYYTISFDPQVSDSTFFHNNIDLLCINLAKIINEKTAGEYKSIIVDAKQKGDVLKKEMAQLKKKLKDVSGEPKKMQAIKDKIKHIRTNQMIQYIVMNHQKITHQQMQLIKKLPFSWESQKSKQRGLMKEDILVREHPFKNMARRTIGSDDSTGKYGIEAKFHTELYGKKGLGWRKKIGPRLWVKVENKPYQMPVNGMDLYTTLDMNFQDIAEVALKKQLIASNAESGCVVVMDVFNGDVKAMANLGSNQSEDPDSRDYFEKNNYAIKDFYGDPGSTFKLASMMALIDNFNINLNDFAIDCKGSLNQGNNELSCSHGHGNLTVQQVFESSCNIGVYTLIKKYFKNPDDFLRIIKTDYKLNNAVFEEHLQGEPTPKIKDRRNKDWSSISLSRMAIGYEIDITPLQMLTFYNAVANNGNRAKPRLVKSIIREDGEEFLKIKPETEPLNLKNPVGTIQKIKMMMEGVVKNGTAKNVNTGICKIAGKTGTAYRLIDGSYNKENQFVSFIGYFPADNPRYSCVVSIRGVTQNANTVSAPVFKEIADKIYAYDITMHKEIAFTQNSKNINYNTKRGLTNDFQTLGKSITMSIPNGKGIVKAHTSGAWESQQLKPSKMPDLRGMTLKDALFVLENRDFSVSFSGIGKVVSQSISPNATIMKQQTVSLILE